MNGKFFFSLFSGCLLLIAAAGQPVSLPVGSRSAALAGGGLTFDGAHSLFTNPAGIARLERLVLLAAAGQPFLLPELQAIQLALGLPTPAGSFAVSLQRQGFAQFNRQHIGLAYARPLTGALSASLRMWLFRTSIRDHGNFYAAGFELGFQHLLTSGLTLGGRLLQPLTGNASQGTEPPPVLALGLGYQLSENVLMILEIEKAAALTARLRVGIEYRPSPQITLRVGGQAPPAAISFGTGIQLGKKISFDASASYHPFLGFSPGIALQFERKD